jgi:hypothetical protein
MRTILDATDRDTLCRRVASLTSASTPRWGRMNVRAMVAHLSQWTRMALGELPVAPRNKVAFQVFPLKHLILYVFPFPKGVPTARELLSRQEEGPIEADQAALQALLQRLGTGPGEGMGPVHPLFGALTRKEWGALAYKHSDHHLRQFGV